MVGYRVLDIETVVDERYWTRPAVKWSPKPLADDGSVAAHLSGVAPPGLLVGTWGTEEPFPPPQAHRVVAIAWVNLSADDNKWYSFESFHVSCQWAYGDNADEVERILLTSFGETQTKDDATLVTWNGRTFDLPVINLRSFKHGIACPWYYEERDVRYRYSEAGHCDLMDFFSDFGAARAMKLGDVARLMGLPGKVGEVSGSNVGEIYRAYEASQSAVRKGGLVSSLPAAMKKVGVYCLSDAMQTAMLFARSRVHKGMISEDYYRSVVAPSFAEPFEGIMKEVG